jgi:hypothetical protein
MLHEEAIVARIREQQLSVPSAKFTDPTFRYVSSEEAQDQVRGPLQLTRAGVRIAR